MNRINFNARYGPSTAVRRILVASSAVIFLAACGSQQSASRSCGFAGHGEFILIPAGQFTQSEQPIYPEEGRPKKRSINSFLLQAHEVTNAQFAQFVVATGYITEAERGLNSDNPAAGSALFSYSVDNSEGGSWRLVNGATWRSPNGAGSTIEGMENFPVVHISHNDAMRYAQWAKGRLPSEQEWEYAAQLSLPDPNLQISAAFDASGTPKANTWQGLFPFKNSAEDGFTGIAPVGCFPAGVNKLVDMIGNVWEWTSTPYSVETAAGFPAGANSFTIKGGSYLCAPNYCQRYRPTARQPQEHNFSTNHIGFRIAKDVAEQK